jgi:hypothetical protein
MGEYPFEDSVIASARWQYLVAWGKVFREAVYASVSNPGAIFHLDRIHRYRSQGVAMGVAPLTITLSDLLAKFFAFCS